MHKYSKEHLFRTHDKITIQKWLSELKYFVFYRAVGGHANDEDTFETVIQFNDEKELKIISDLIDLELTKLADQQTIHHKILDYNWVIKKIKNHVFVHPYNAKPYEVNDTDFEACKEFEKLIELKELKINSEYLNNKPRAITYALYSEYFNN